MEIKVIRKYKKDTYCIGEMLVNGEHFCETCEDRDRGLRSDMTLSQIKKIKVYAKTAIPYGRYEVKSYFWPKYRKVYPWLQNVKGFTGILMHCLTPDMEILTENGWQNLKSFKGNRPKYCFSFNTETKKIEMVPVMEFIERQYDGNIYISDGARVKYAVTDKHRMYVNVKKRDGSYEWQWRTADNIPTQTKFLTSAIKEDGWDISAYQKTLYRIIMAVQADGYILNWSNTASQVKFHFKKDRKIYRIKELLSEIGETWREFVDCEGKTNIVLSPSLSEYITEMMNPNRIVKNTKDLPYELLNLKGEDMRDLVMEYLFWDGRYTNYLKNNNNMTISSVNKRTIDILQAMATMGGLRASIHVSVRTDGRRDNLIELKLYNNQSEVMPESNTFHTEPYSGQVWCISNKNATIIVRRKGYVSIIGNCGRTADNSSGCLLLGENKIKGGLINGEKYVRKLTEMVQECEKRGEKVYITICKE